MTERRGRGELHQLAELLRSGIARTVGALRRGDEDPHQIVAYRSFASAERALVLGRVLENEGIEPADPALSPWRNLVNALKRIEADPLPFARVRALLRGRHAMLTADDEGYIAHWVDLHEHATPGWNPIELELVDERAGASLRATAMTLVPPPTARFAVVSDMDDTVLQSDITSFLRAARLILLENARTRLPFPGVAAFYRALHDAEGGGNPIFYVSSSPWNLYDVIADFLEAQEIPVGPLLLRDWDIRPSLLRNREYKAERIEEILRTYPSLPFVLVGDSGQEDPEIYKEIVHRHPGRVLAVYVRNVSRAPGRAESIRALAREVREAGSTLVLADDTLAIARHAALHGWIAEDHLGEIAGEKRADEGMTAEKVETPGVEPVTAPTVVVDASVRASDVE